MTSLWVQEIFQLRRGPSSQLRREGAFNYRQLYSKGSHCDGLADHHSDKGDHGLRKGTKSRSSSRCASPFHENIISVFLDRVPRVQEFENWVKRKDALNTSLYRES